MSQQEGSCSESRTGAACGAAAGGMLWVALDWDGSLGSTGFGNAPPRSNTRGASGHLPPCRGPGLLQVLGKEAVSDRASIKPPG